MTILLHVPMALVGGALALAVARMILSVSAAVGFIALLGQAVLNGVLVLAAIRALLASLGLLPAALSHAIGSETQRPIAVVVVGGTITAALLTLIVLPVSYAWATAYRERLFARLAPAREEAA